MKRGTLLVGADYCASYLWLPHILPAFSEQYPGITTKICQQTSPMFEEDLLKNEINRIYGILEENKYISKYQTTVLNSSDIN